MEWAMKLVLLTVVAAVQIGGAFGEASVQLDELADDSMIVDLQVEVGVSAEAVVAHFSFDDVESFAIPLLDRGGGVYGIRTELEPVNYVVVFEAVGPGELSEAWTLTALGADFGMAEPDGPMPSQAPEEQLSNQTQSIGWLALALAAASLSALAFWVLGGDQDEVVATSAQEE